MLVVAKIVAHRCSSLTGLRGRRIQSITVELSEPASFDAKRLLL